jgi:hypothetical protein
VSGFGTATGVTITAATLNGVPANDLNLIGVGPLGDIAAGKSTIAHVTFPASAAASGTSVYLSVLGSYSFGQTFSNGYRYKVP